MGLSRGGRISPHHPPARDDQIAILAVIPEEVRYLTKIHSIIYRSITPLISVYSPHKCSVKDVDHPIYADHPHRLASAPAELTPFILVRHHDLMPVRTNIASI